MNAKAYMKERLGKAKTFNDLQTAKKAGMKINQADNDELVSVWKAPANMGGKYALIPTEDREIAFRMGYEIEVEDYDLKDQIDEIKEV